MGFLRIVLAVGIWPFMVASVSAQDPCDLIEVVVSECVSKELQLYESSFDGVTIVESEKVMVPEGREILGCCGSIDRQIRLVNVPDSDVSSEEQDEPLQCDISIIPDIAALRGSLQDDGAPFDSLSGTDDAGNGTELPVSFRHAPANISLCDATIPWLAESNAPENWRSIGTAWLIHVPEVEEVEDLE